MAVAAGAPQDDDDEARVDAEAIVDTVREPLLVLAADLTVVSANRAFYRRFAATPAATAGRRVYELGDGRPWDVPALREALERVLPEGRGFEDVEVEHDAEGLGRRALLVNGRLLRRGGGRPDLILLAIEDVTERRRAERELVEAKEFAEAIVDTVREPLLVLTPELRVRSANESFYRVFGVGPGETLGRPVYELGDGQWDIPELRRLLERILPNDRAFNGFAVEHEFPGIGRRSMLLNARRLDHTQLILLAIEDVTGRRRAEAAEAEWHWRHAAAVRAGGLVLYDSDKRTGAIAWGGEADRVLGYPPEELGGYDWWFERVHPEDRGRLADAMRRALARREPVAAEYRLRCRDGHYRVVVDRGELVTDAAGEVVRVVGFIQDITARREAEVALRESEARFRRAVTGAAVPIMMHAEDGEILAVSDGLVRITGYDRARLRRIEDWLGLAFGGRAGEVARMVADYFGDERPVAALEFEVRTRSGDRRSWVFTGSTPDRLADGRKYYVVIATDITERKRAEEQRELLVAELSHRVRNLLALVQSLAAQTALRSRSVEEFRTVFDGRLHALARTHGLLFEARWRGADLRALVGEMLEPYRLDRQEAIAIEGEPVTLPPKHGLTLSLVLHELGTNAAKYGALSAPAGRVRVSWRSVEGEEDEGKGGGRCIRLRWEERGGPRVEPPAETGFGTRLIERACAYELGGRAELLFDPGGLRCEIDFPLP